MDDSPVQPTRQEVISLFDSFIVAVSLPDGRIAATLGSLCDALGLAQNSQSRRIRLDDVLADELLECCHRNEQRHSDSWRIDGVGDSLVADWRPCYQSG